eukprot:c24480_g1_i1 orf=323-1558(-)
MEIPSWVFWLQVAYSLWTFFRNAKFLRVPFILASMAWNGGTARTWFARRKVLLLDGLSRETGSDWEKYNTEEQFERFEFEIHNDYEISFKLKSRRYKFIASRESGKPIKFLHFAEENALATQDLVLLGKMHLIKAVAPERMFEFVLKGGVMKEVEVDCLVDNTSSELLNDNFMRIMSIGPLALQARGLDQMSTLLSFFLIFMDLFSYWFNQVWMLFKEWGFKTTKLLLSFFGVRARVMMHELLSTGSDSFMFCDDSRKKVYFRKLKRFLAVRGCQIPVESSTSHIVVDMNEDVPELLELTMGLKTFKIQTEKYSEEYYHITLSDEVYKERREFLPKSLTLKIVNYMKLVCDMGFYPVAQMSSTSVHVINPIKAMVEGVYEWVLMVELHTEKEYFVSNYTLQDRAHYWAASM